MAALGLRKGDRVAIVAENGPRWLQADVGVMLAGGIDVPRGTQEGAARVASIVEHAGCRMAFVQDPATLDTFRPALAGLERTILLAGEGEGALAFEDLLEAGNRAPPALPETGPDDVATLVYTSGTTGDPKGITLLHRNVVSNVRSLPAVLPVEPGWVFLTVLPTWHMYERTVEYYAADRGAVLSYSDLRRFRADLAEERPHVLPSVPRIWETIHAAVEQGLRKKPAPVRALAGLAVRRSLAYARARRTREGRTVEALDGATAGGSTALLRPFHALADRLVYSRMRELTGGNLVAAVSGGGALPPHVDAFFDAAGIRLLVGYGLTETSPVVALRRPERNVLGTIGTPIADTELRVVEPESGDDVAEGGTGVLHVRGPQVMAGYWRNEDATRRVLSDDGWFDTGDLCRLSSAGDIVFCGRAKDTIVLRGGENVEPEPLEQAALASPLLAQIVLVGQDRRNLGALVWPDPGAIEDAEGDALRLVKAELDARLGPGGGFQPWERVHGVALLPEELSVGADTLTPTLKVRRNVVAERYASLIDGLYARD